LEHSNNPLLGYVYWGIAGDAVVIELT